MKYLNYRGDVRQMVGQVVGPDLFGTFHRAITVFRRGGGGTRVGFRLLRTDERRALAEHRPMPPLTEEPS